MSAKKVKVAAEEREFMFSSESVNEGHPDKLADQVSDAVLDACLKGDPYSKVACETATKDNMVMVFGEITTQAQLDYDAIVRAQVREIGFSSFVDDLSSVDSKGLSCDSCEVLVRINKQSPDIAGGVHVGKSDLDVGAGDQGIMFGYASDETSTQMPLTHMMATKLGKVLTEVRKDGSLWWLRPDGKTQVTIKYQQKADGSVEPLMIHTVVISTQHAEPLKRRAAFFRMDMSAGSSSGHFGSWLCGKAGGFEFFNFGAVIISFIARDARFSCFVAHHGLKPSDRRILIERAVFEA